MKRLLVLALTLAAGAGCTSDRLRRSTINQATTLTDLQYEQVLNNLAMFCQNPEALPWHVSLRDGSAQVADLGALTIGGELAHASKATPSFLGSRTVVEQWGMTPVTDDTELRVLRAAYRRALGFADSLEDNGNDLANDLAHELKKQTTDFNEFQDQIDRTFADGKTRYRNEQLQSLASAAATDGWRNMLGFLMFGNTSSAGSEIANVLFPYRYTLAFYEGNLQVKVTRVSRKEDIQATGSHLIALSQVGDGDNLHVRIFGDDGRILLDAAEGAPRKPLSARQFQEIKSQLAAKVRWPVPPGVADLSDVDQAELAEAIGKIAGPFRGKLPATDPYYDHLEKALSVVNENIIVEGERLTDRIEWKNNMWLNKRFDNYTVDESIINEYGYHVNIVTPFAAEIRRQVKEVQSDLMTIGPGWYHVGCKKDVPKVACYVGHYRDCYVWVDRNGLGGLTNFTLKVLNFASLIRDPTIFTTPGPRFTPASSFPTL